MHRVFEDPGPTTDSNREPAIPESASVDIRTSASVDFQSSASIDNKPQNLTTPSLQNRSTQSLQHRSMPSEFLNSPRLKSRSPGEGTRIERRKRKGMQMQIPYQ
ncbi:hypothetical protein F2Q68_00044104 [Brassica cretica]|uniref:Uncharacterized protein n=1 Tax=Brassica cretica TaxID=69181 RepID=A0A8S9LKW2_BRACR|nr:hypothetical protein F2Q68_00044104 [Brassica cretica]